MTLYMMRHGETDYNAQRRFYGSSDVPLNAKGRQQAIAMAEQVVAVPIERVYVSSLRRTQETAELVFGGAYALEVVKDWDEKGFGAWEGLTADQIEAAYPSQWLAWLERPFDVTPPAAEPFHQFRERVQAAARALNLGASSASVAIVGHLGVLRLLYQELVDPAAVFWEIDFPQGQVICLHQDDKGQWSCQSLAGVN
nr:histidine phosphatase family protein [Streptococcus ovuberis]